MGLNPGTIDTCTGMSGAIVDIVSNLDARVDMVVSGHTHNAYNCRLPNSEGALIPVSSSSSFGRLVTDIDLTINSKSGKPTQISVDNKIVVRDDQDAAAAALVSTYQALVAPIANRVVGSITATITRTADAEGESALGDVIADAQLAWSQAAAPRSRS